MRITFNGFLAGFLLPTLFVLLGDTSLNAHTASTLFRINSLCPSGFINASLDSPKDTVKKILRTDDAKGRELLFDQLKKYPEGEVIRTWLDLLEKTDSFAQKQLIIMHLARYNDKSITVPLSAYLVHPVKNIRENAAITLKKIGDDRLFPAILRIAGDENPVHRIYFLEAMNHLYDRRFQGLVTGLVNDRNKSVRIFALNCLYRNKPGESLPLVRSAAQHDPVDDVRIAAMEMLGNSRDGVSLGIMHQGLVHPNRELRSASVRAITKIRSESSAQPLSQRLQSENDNEIKALIIEALAALKRPGDTKGLERIIAEDQNTSLRIRAAYALGTGQDQRSIPLLIKSLQDRDPRVRAEICNSLGNFKTKQSQSALLQICEKDTSLYVRSAALYSIKRMNDRSMTVHLFDIYSRERHFMFREMLRTAIREFIEKYL